MGKEEQFFLKHMTDLMNQAYITQRPVVSSFLNLYEQSLLYTILASPNSATAMQYDIPDIDCEMWGGYADAERKRILFSNRIEKKYFKICVLHISSKYPKFASEMNHRDFLGAILNLGIKRETIGDILVEDQHAYVICHEDIADFIIEELKYVKRTAVQCEKFDTLPDSYTPRIRSEHSIVASLRLDCVIATAFHLSRKEAQQKIEKEFVFVDSRLIHSCNVTLKEGQVISVRGYGKFILRTIGGNTKKGRMNI